MAKDLHNLECVILICNGSDCKKKGASELKKAAKRHLKDSGKFRDALIMCTKCNGHCKKGPIVGVQPANKWLTKASKAKLKDLLDAC
jgi:NADH:ubiquinone oxidoreductase subunit E